MKTIQDDINEFEKEIHLRTDEEIDAKVNSYYLD
jgi:hypothetical protein